MSRGLEREITSALADDGTAPDKLVALIDKVKNGIAAAERDAAKQRKRALDPALSPDLGKARRAMEDAAFLVGRLKTLLPRLQCKLADIQAAEEHARWLEDYERVEAKRDGAAKAFERYPELINELLEILHGARLVDAEVDRVNGTAPAGEHRRLRTVELTARDLTNFSATQPSLAERIRLPDAQGERILWPPQRHIDPAMIKPIFDPYASGDWGVIQDQQREIASEQAKREQQARDEAAAAEATRMGGGADWFLRNWKPSN